jgi:glycosyltransferase involved in cell wall biosynthesis
MNNYTKRQIPRVSIGMPVYNGELFIREALDSLLAQTFTDFELIISDNASTDDTEAICREHATKDSRIRYVRQSENRGPMFNFKFVLDQAQAEYFMWAAADDLWDRDFINKCLSALEQNREIDGAFSKFHVHSMTYPILKMRYFPHMNFLSSPDPFTRISHFILLSEASHKANVIYGLWKRRILKNMQRVFENLDHHYVYLGLDIAQIVYILSMSMVYQIPEPLFFKRYKNFPPGYITSSITCISQVIRHGNQQHHKDIASHIMLLQKSMELAGIYNNHYQQVLDIKLKMGIERYSTLSNILREVLNSLRAGVV